MFSVNHSDFQAVQAQVERYFYGLHHADVSLLAGLFDDHVVLVTPGVRRQLTEWFALIQSRPVPEIEGHEFAYKILSLEVYGSQAMVKVECPLLGHNYIDYLGLIKENGNWLIVSKMYIDYEQTPLFGS